MLDTDVSTYAMVITASDLSRLTGHHNFACHIEETRPDGTVVHGVPEVWGIEYRALQSRFAGSIEQWRDWVQAQMHSRHIARMAVHAEILDWQGKTYPIK
jgi:hypothetical protein